MSKDKMLKGKMSKDKMSKDKMLKDKMWKDKMSKQNVEKYWKCLICLAPPDSPRKYPSQVLGYSQVG
jgi:hypothetical protein